MLFACYSASSLSRNLGIDPGGFFVVALAGMTQLRGHNSNARTPAKKELMKRWWIILYLCVLPQPPASIWAQTLPEMRPDTSGVALTSPSTPQPLDASEDEHNTNEFPTGAGVKLDRLTVLPDDGRELYFSAIDAATDRIRIEICVLEDPQILQHLQAALSRGVRVRVIVDRGKYSALDAEQQNLALYLTSAGGQLHLSNPVFPRSSSLIPSCSSTVR